ncbi:caffeine-induced death protein-like protein [Amylocarpus encephaloides]|uniref:Caffeine-induced death protein-like protein n=1 Tax=Amylocarpus encephaloides TaxID=45428 RepID=A0A9P7Y7I2_9HELO|nr:caffeine-induced death protein-like protein [Amylocarpus encephaloides]
MFPSSQVLIGNDEGDLESRIRGLIISNSASNSPAEVIDTTELPDFNCSGPSDQSSSAQPVNANARSKRPNQSQRRQMNSQLSIPINNRPGPANSNVSYGSPSGNGPPQRMNTNLQSSPYIQQNYPGYNQNSAYSPQFQNNGPLDPYSPRPFIQQASPRSPMPPQQYGMNSPNFNHQSPRAQQFQNSQYSPRPSTRGWQLYQPNNYQRHGRNSQFDPNSENILGQSSYLELLLQQNSSILTIDPHEETEKEEFRAIVEQACRDAILTYEKNDLGDQTFDSASVQLLCFGSMRTGFATRASDMDLALLSPKSRYLPDAPDSPIPRILEKTLLNMGYGARLLTRTRVPIIKLCQKPTDKLRADLLQERTKWEEGFKEESSDRDGGQDIGGQRKSHPLHSIVQVQQKTVKASATDGHTTTESSPHSSTLAEWYTMKLENFKQKEGQSLGDYHICAKRLLQSLGGRDIQLSNSHDVSKQEATILNDVCRAFVSGLISITLVERLKKYPSVSALFDPSQSLPRTLQGTWLQAEGERIAMGWADRVLKEENNGRENECQILVDNWQNLQATPAPCSLAECMKFNRDLYICNEQLKRITSLQLLCLKQMHQEEPVNYYARARKLLDILKGGDRQESTRSITPTVVARYVSGITNQNIRGRLKSLTIKKPNLQQVALQHRILQLIADYEHALASGIYQEKDRSSVDQYIRYLTNLDVTDSTFAAGSNACSDDLVLITKIRSLPDPGPNKSRDRYKDHLEFPKSNIGIQCDINFSAHLALHNTLLLRCYSLCDPRVKTMILFIKHWAKTRGINTPYRGSLSSYGYVLMVIHYLVNITQPFVCPNLQEVNKDPPSHLSPAEIAARTTCNGCDVRFWRNEAEIKDLADRKMLNHNHDSIGFLIRGFYEYYAQIGQLSTVKTRGFDWSREVLSLRTPGGRLSKQEKGWVGAKTTVETKIVTSPRTIATKVSESTKDEHTGGIVSVDSERDAKTPKHASKQIEETKEVRHRYLFAIEDPFELDHNVARTVTHDGIVSIRDEFRRALRIIRNIGKPEERDGGLLDPIGDSEVKGKSNWQELMNLLHGPVSKTRDDPLKQEGS